MLANLDPLHLRGEAEGTSAAASLRPPCHHGNSPGGSSGGAWAPFPVDTLIIVTALLGFSSCSLELKA